MALNVYKEWLGIPEEDCPPDHYALLRLVQFEDDPERIQGNYRKLNAHVRKYATGQYAKESQALLNEIAKAMLCLTDPETKRDYDESLGREFDDDQDLFGRKPLGQSLIDDGIVTRDQMKEAESFADARGLYLRDAVVQMKLTDIETATRAYAVELGVPFLDLNETLPDDSVLDMVPRNLVKRNTFIPMFIDDDHLLIVSAGEPDQDLVDELRLRFNMPLKYALATPLSVNQAISKYYAPGMREEAVEPPKRSDVAPAKSSKTAKEKPDKKEKKEKSKAPKQAVEQSSDRKMIGIMMICWSVIGSYFLGEFLNNFFDESAIVAYLTIALIAGPVTFWVVKSYWKS